MMWLVLGGKNPIVKKVWEMLDQIALITLQLLSAFIWQYAFEL